MAQWRGALQKTTLNSATGPLEKRIAWQVGTEAKGMNQ